MSEPSERLYEFGAFRLDGIKRLLRRQGEVVPLTPKAFDILLALVESSGKVVEKDELMSRVWAGTVVEESNLAHHISVLRRTLQDNRYRHRYIVTVPGRGYSFVASVRQPQLGSVDPVVTKHTRSEISIEEEADGDGDLCSVDPERLREKPGLIARLRSASLTVLLSITRGGTHKRRVAIAVALFAFAITGVILSISKMSDESDITAPPAVDRLHVTKLTNTGNASWPAISPDGKYIAYVSRDVAGKSIWIKHVGTGSAHQIRAPERVRHLGQLTFSRDASFVYFVESEEFGPSQHLFRLAVLGGIPARVISDLEGYALSPEGSRFVFVRSSRGTDESFLMVARADGTEEYKLAVRELNEGYASVAWSPDGRAIACSVGSTEVSGERMYPVEVRVSDGSERELTSHRWVYLGGIMWLADGRGILASGYSQGSIAAIWYISTAGGEVRKLIDDANTISGLGLTTDCKTMVGQTLALHTNLWTAPIGNGVASPAALARQLTTGTSNYRVCGWMPDGRILFTAGANNPLGVSVWVMNADGTGQKQLTADSEASESPVFSPNGRYIVFVSNRACRFNIWRMDDDGGDPKQLTYGNNEKAPTCSPDGKWVVYTAGDDSSLWKVPMQGGKAEQLTGSYWRYAIFSPDGKWLAALHRGKEPDAPFKIGILPFAGGAPVKMLEPPPDISFNWYARWTRDGRALIYSGTRDGVTNLWWQPLDGGEATLLTDFKAADEIYGFDLSPDGKHVVFARGAWTFDLVLIRNFL